jgi:hypothetical protein
VFALLRSAKKLKDLDERVNDFERQMKRLRLEWEDTYEMLRRLMQRIAKRSQRDEQSSPEPETTSPEPETLPPGGPVLSPRHQTLQQKILARRRMNGVQ